MLSETEKMRRKRERMIEKAREYSVGTYKNRFVAPVFQRMIRAEAGALPAGSVDVIADGKLRHYHREVGQCHCVTCGTAGHWSSGLGGIHTGHFLASRTNSILFDEDNVAPQCSRCNRYENGAPQRFRQWMLAVRGEDTIKRLEELKRTIVSFSKEDLVDMRIQFQDRLDVAMDLITQGTQHAGGRDTRI